MTGNSRDTKLPYEIGTEAGRIFTYHLPPNWIFRSQEDQNDFGIDGEIELTDESGRALGKHHVFKVQIKGEENSRYINDGKHVSFKLKMERLKYYFTFRVPVVLVVVETSSEKIYWLSITDNSELRSKAAEAGSNSSIQIHIPVENNILRKNLQLSEALLNAVTKCWDFLSLQGLKESVQRYPNLSSIKLNKRIDDIGEALYSAFHQQLSNLLSDRDFKSVFELAAKLSNSPLVPAKDQFVALLYYWQAFQISPFTSVRKEQLETDLNVCILLINLARQEKSRPHRLTAIGKARITKLKHQVDRLHALHFSTEHLIHNSFEKISFDSQTQELYQECCTSIQKSIELSSRLGIEGHYSILTDLFIDLYASILVFSSVHGARGTKEAITFLNDWRDNMSEFVMKFCVISRDIFRIRHLYYLISTLLIENPDATVNVRACILSDIPELEESLDEIENSLLKQNKISDFSSLGIEQQKAYFTAMSKNLGMDPDDPQNELGRIVKNGLSNYDPTPIMKECENLFIHYRPGGMVAETLRMHSAGGMHLLICLKHNYAMGTGGLITSLYEDPESPVSDFSFKHVHCNNCSDCIPRDSEWQWNLKWYNSTLEKSKDIVGKFKL